MTSTLRPNLSSWRDYQEPVEPSRVVTIGGGVAAAVAAGAVMLLLRSTIQVRSIPERMLEWSLLFVPLDVFEAMLQRFGFSSKVYGLYFGIGLMLVALAWLGYFALKRKWPLPVLVGLGLGLWLFTMIIILPLTSAGFFAMSLLEGMRETVLGYLVVGLVYSGVLALVHVLVYDPEPEPVRVGGLSHAAVTPRRAALGLLGSSAVALGITYVLGVLLPHRTGLPTIVIADPQEPVPSGGLAEPNPHPAVVPSPAAAAPAAAPPQPTVAQPKPSVSSLPEPASARTLTRDQDGAVLPSGRRPGQLADPITSNENFYIVTKNAGGDPVIHPDDWRLVVDGEVPRSFELDYATLRRLPSVEFTKTLECISNLVTECQLAPFGCDLISTARWKGVRISDILNLVGGVNQGATYVATISADEYTTALPMSAVMSQEALLVYEMNGQVLPREHGYPARILVPNRYGMKNAKWVVALRPMRREFIDWYGQRSWSREGIVKPMTRIDIPNRDARLTPGPQRIAGIAYAGDHGVQMVEFSSDGGETWEEASFIEQPTSRDMWVRWEGSFNLAAGEEAALVARLTDGSGNLQPEPFSLAQPDGASGWNSISVRSQ